MATKEISDYRSIFLENKPLIDLRSPGEFLNGAFPTACNIPLLSDDERATIGLRYRQHGQQAAIDLGNQIVTGLLREERLASWSTFARTHPDGSMYCFRGGLRSSITQEWLSDLEINYPLVKGGYKAMRRFLINSLEHALTHMELILVSGRTGVGKTRVVSALERGIDLEELAKHRGSTFGQLLEPQPSQINFENALSIEMLKLLKHSNKILFLEDEGKLIGRISLPKNLRAGMARAPMIFVEASLSERVETILQDYVLDLGEGYQKLYGSEGAKLHRDRLLNDLFRIRRRLGEERHKKLRKKIGDAFEKQWSESCFALHREWISSLLQTYYDPMYDYQLSKREGRHLMSGSRSEIIGWAKDYSGCVGPK